MLFVFLLFGTLLLFLCFPAACVSGAKSGLLLWSEQLLPSMLPFLILTNVLLATGLHRTLGRLLSPILRPLLGLSESGCFSLLAGFLSGLPLGAKTVSTLYRNGELSRREGAALLCLCSNPSPMFLVSYAGITQLHLTGRPYLILLFVLCSALLCYGSFRLLQALPGMASARSARHPHPKAVSDIEQTPRSRTTSHAADSVEFSFSLLNRCILDGFETITVIGGYLMLFSIYTAVLTERIPAALPPLLRILPPCLLEMTTGIAAICRTVSSPSLALPLVAACAAFGGFSGLAQTKSVLDPQLLPFPVFLGLKGLHALLSGTLALLYVLLF